MNGNWAVRKWEAGKSRPKDKKRTVLVALRKLPCGEVKNSLRREGPNRHQLAACSTLDEDTLKDKD